MKRGLLIVPLLAVACTQSSWEPANVRLHTRWAAAVSPSNARAEYPRPMMRRDEWLCLNGVWDYAITVRDSEPAAFDGAILVPFPVESSLSGVADTVGESRSLWYRRTFEIPGSWFGERVLLHFEAVDWETLVWVNDVPVGYHRGGYDPFTFDITDVLREGPQDLVVSVWDPTDAGTQPRGKQVREPGGIFYTSVTGIWQTVWLEPVPETAIENFAVVPHIDRESVSFTVDGERTETGDVVQVTVSASGNVVATEPGDVGAPVNIAIPEPRLWSPDDPFLYDLQLKLVRDGVVLDSVVGYFGMRKTSVGPDEAGVTRLLLNNEFLFQIGPLDQGYWPDGLYTAPTEEAMFYDLEVLKAMGFNMLRKHVKVEPRTFYSWCDRLGLLVWQDMPNANIPVESRGSDTATDPEATAQFETELVQLVRTHRNHPSIVMWVPFNEGWGQYDSERIVNLVRETDPTRPVNHASGWYERGVGDVVDRHSYPAPRAPEPEPRRAAVQGEYGGLGFNIPGHMWQEEGWGYALFPDRESLTQRFEDFLKTIHQARDRSGLSGAIYTQTTDIETENNGLMTYDREVAKIDPEAVALANRGYFAPRVVRRAAIFLDSTAVELAPPEPGVRIHYTSDGSDPTEASPTYDGAFEISESSTIKARAIFDDGTASRVSTFEFTKVSAKPAESVTVAEGGLTVDYYEHEGDWGSLPDFDSLTAVATGVALSIDLTAARREDNFGLRFHGFFRAAETGVYGFFLTSDDGSRLSIAGQQLIDNDGVHGARERSGYVALEAGLHSIEVLFFQGGGGRELRLSFEGPGRERQEITSRLLSHR